MPELDEVTPTKKMFRKVSQENLVVYLVIYHNSSIYSIWGLFNIRKIVNVSYYSNKLKQISMEAKKNQSKTYDCIQYPSQISAS